MPYAGSYANISACRDDKGRYLAIGVVVDRMRTDFLAFGVVLIMVGLLATRIPVMHAYEVEVPYTIIVPEEIPVIDEELSTNDRLPDDSYWYWDSIPVTSWNWARIDLSSSQLIEVTITGAGGKKIYRQSGMNLFDMVYFDADQVIRVEILNPPGPGKGETAVVNGNILIGHDETDYSAETRYETETRYVADYPFIGVGAGLFGGGVALAAFGAASKPKPPEPKPPAAVASCPHCGAALHAKADYCIACGKKIH